MMSYAVQGNVRLSGRAETVTFCDPRAKDLGPAGHRRESMHVTNQMVSFSGMLWATDNEGIIHSTSAYVNTVKHGKIFLEIVFFSCVL